MTALDGSRVVTAAQMQAIEQVLFAAGMPVEALMEKVSQRIVAYIQAHFPSEHYPRIGVLVGTGHNGGDALGVARELALEGRSVQVWVGRQPLKPLTASHLRYLQWLGGIRVEDIHGLNRCSLLLDGLFGIGLSRPLTDPLMVQAVQWVNQSGIPVVSVDLPSGLNADTGAVMGAAIRAHTTLCLGLGKQGVYQDSALEYLGTLEVIDFGIPPHALDQVLADAPPTRLITPGRIRTILAYPSLTTHKYRQGHLLLIVGSTGYGGAALLTALGARASGAGMVTVLVPQSLKPLVQGQVPEALVVGCPETPLGGIAQLPDLNWSRYQAIGVGPGLGVAALDWMDDLLSTTIEIPWVVDADGLNALAQLGIQGLQRRRAATVITPHEGEFRRLFPALELEDRISASRRAAQQSGVTVLLKGARTLLADPTGAVWINPSSTPALARGGSGDVLAGLLAGILAQGKCGTDAAMAAVWRHSQAALALEHRRGWTGVDPVHLASELSRH